MGKRLNAELMDCKRRAVLGNFLGKIKIKESPFSPEEKKDAKYVKKFLGEMANGLLEEAYPPNRRLIPESFSKKIYSAFGGDLKNPDRNEILGYASEIMQMQKRIGKIIRNPEGFYKSEDYPIFLEDLITICYECL